MCGTYTEADSLAASEITSAATPQKSLQNTHMRSDASMTIRVSEADLATSISLDGQNPFGPKAADDFPAKLSVRIPPTASPEWLSILFGYLLKRVIRSHRMKP